MGILLSFFALATLLVSVPPAGAQETTASIAGTITDSSGAAVVGATVTARDIDRGTMFTAKTTDLGYYLITRVPVGNFQVSVEAPGFQKSVTSTITLVLNQVARIDVQLKVGQQTTVVEVTAAPPVLQTQTTEVSTIIDARTNDNLPLATRNPTQLTLLAPGAVSVDPANMNLGSNTAEGGDRPYINGNREEANNFLLDGIDDNQVSENILGFTPSPDAIQEFNLITTNASAEFGNFQGGIVNTTIKSGTNQYHGDVFEFFRNDYLNANKWEATLSSPTAPTPALRWNMFGGTFGGPIIKNKLFFFVDYQGGRFDHPATTGSITVLTNDQRTGDFSNLLAIATPEVLYNPCAAGSGVAGSPCQLVPAASRVPFTDNKIPTAMLDPVFTALVTSPLYPAEVATTTNGFAKATNTTNQQFNTDQGDFKLDYDLSEKDRFSARYTQGYQFDPSSNSVALLGGNLNTAHLYNMGGTWVHSFTPSVLNELRFGINRVGFQDGATTFSGAVGDLGTTLGIADANPNGIPGLLELAFGGGTITNIGNGSLSNLGSALVNENFGSTVVQFDDGLSFSHGSHTFKVGFQMNRYRIDVFYSGNGGELGGILFNGQYTGTGSTTLGDPAADFALGLPSYVGRGVSTGGWHQRDWLIAGYLEDTWRATSNLTLNAGVRYEARTPWVETGNRQSSVNILTGAVEIAGQDGNSRGLYNSTYGWPDIQPRLGFAWTPASLGGKTVVRGAYTVSSFLEGTGTNLRLPQNPPFTPAQTEGANTTNTGDIPFTTAAGSIAASSPPGANPYQDAVMNAWYGTVQPAIVQQWNLTLQHEIANNTTLQVGYVGEKGTHLMVPEWLTQGILQSNGTILPTPYVGGENNPSAVGYVAPAACPTDTNITYGPNCFGGVKDTASVGGMRYNALQAVLQKRYSNGLTAQLSYTYSKCMTNNSGYFGTWTDTTAATPASPYFQNLYNPNAEWAQCYWDSKHVVSAYAVYELPFGQGKKFAHDVSTPVNLIVGGWSINPIISWHTGFPFAIYSPVDSSGTGSQGARPDCNGTPIYQKQNVPGFGLQWVSPATFSIPATGTFGNCPAQGPVIGPGYSDSDISIQKNFLFGETKRLQFRADILNAFNHPNFAHMDNTVGDSNFGVITVTQDAREIQLALKFYF